jgi:hypothetical protein
MNFKEKLGQNAGNRISEVLDIKFSPDPPTSPRFSASVNKTTGSAPAHGLQEEKTFSTLSSLVFPTVSE